MVKLIFNIPLISVNKLYANIRSQGRRFVSPEGKIFKASIEIIVKNALDANTLTYLSSLTGKRLAITVKIQSPSWVLKDGKTIRRKDLENQLKALNDSIFTVFNTFNASLDDSQIWSITLLKEVGALDQTEYTISECM